MLVRAWEPGKGRVALRAEAARPGRDRARRCRGRRGRRRPAPAELELALERMRFALGVDDDLGEFYRRFRRDPLLGPLIRRLPAICARAAAPGPGRRWPGRWSSS